MLDLDGYVLLPAPVEPHAHLDKAFLAERILNPQGHLLGAIEAMDANRDSLTAEDIADRAERAARLMVANGTTAIRSHADIVTGHGLRSVEGLVEARRRLGDLVDLQIVALISWPVTGLAGADHRALARDALAAGADVVGGCPHLDDDPVEAHEVLLELAAGGGHMVDLHTDETLDLAVLGLRDLAQPGGCHAGSPIASRPAIASASACSRARCSRPWPTRWPRPASAWSPCPRPTCTCKDGTPRLPCLED